MFDDLDDLLEDVPQHKSKPSNVSSGTAGTKLVTQVGLGLAGKRPQTAKNNDDEFDWDRPQTASHH